MLYLRFMSQDIRTFARSTSKDLLQWTEPVPADFGDAPVNYGTSGTANSARHTIVPGFSLGAAIDADTPQTAPAAWPSSKNSPAPLRW